LAIIPIVSPPQIAGDIPVIIILTVGKGFTVTVTFVESAQPDPSVPTTVYVVVEPGVAVTFESVVALKPVAGLQLYVVAPLAVKPILLPWHTDGVGGVTVTVGVGLTVTVTVVESAHVPLEPTTVYVVVESIVTTGFGQVVQLKPVAGLQL